MGVPEDHQGQTGVGAARIGAAGGVRVGGDDPALAQLGDARRGPLGGTRVPGVAPLLVALVLGGDDRHVRDLARLPAQHRGAGVVLRGAFHPGGGVAQHRVLVGAGERYRHEQGGGDQPDPAASTDPGQGAPAGQQQRGDPGEDHRGGQDPESGRHRHGVPGREQQVGDQQRPVPQVDPVGPVPEPLQRTRRQEPGSAGPGVGCQRTAEQDRRGPQGGGQGHGAGEAGVGADEEGGGEDRGQPGPAQDHPGHPVRGAPAPGGRPRGAGAGQGQGCHRAQGELPQPGQGAEVGRLGPGRGGHHRPGQRAGEHGGEHDPGHRAEPGPGPPGRHGGPGQQQRPHQEHLALHRQRPHVLQRGRGRGVAGVVVHGLVRQHPVHDVEQRPPGLGQQLGPPAGREPEEHRGEHGQQQHRHRAQQPGEGPGPVGRQCQGPAVLDPAGEGAGEQERGEHEEHVHPAGDLLGPHVEDHHQQHGHPAQTLQVRAVGGPRGRAAEDRHGLGGAARRALGHRRSRCSSIAMNSSAWASFLASRSRSGWARSR